MKTLTLIAVIVSPFIVGSSAVHAEQHLRPKQECIDLAQARGFTRSQGQHGGKNSDMNQFVYNCRRGLVK